MDNETYFAIGKWWDSLTPEMRSNFARKCGWHIAKDYNRPDRTARKLSKQIWCELSKCAQNVIARFRCETFLA